MEENRQRNATARSRTDTADRADDIATILKLKNFEDTHGLAMAKVRIAAWHRRSNGTAQVRLQYYRDTKKLVDSPKAEVADLQERKEAGTAGNRQAKQRGTEKTERQPRLQRGTNTATEGVLVLSWQQQGQEMERRIRICMSVYLGESQEAALTKETANRRKHIQEIM